jgi:putative ABC transport system permease protein
MSAQHRKKRHRFIRLVDVLRLATTSLSSNKLRSALTIVGITIGVFSVVGTMTALSAIRSSINSGLAMFGSDTFNISRYPSLMVGGDGRWNYRHRPRISYQEAKRFKRLMDKEGIRVSISDDRNGQRVNFRDRRTSPNICVYGSNEYTIDAYNFKLGSGRFIGDDDLTFNRSVVVIGYDVSETLFYDRDPIGNQVTINGHRFTVVGVMKEKGDIFGQNQDNYAFIPMTRFITDIYNRHISISFQVMAPSPDQIPQTMDVAIGNMRLVRGLEPEDPNDFTVDSNDSMQAAFDKIARIVGVAGLIISFIALITAGVGIMNIMLVSVTERTREIGIRKSIGARGTDIMKQFLLESVFLSELGAMIGILLGYSLGNVFALVIGVNVVFPVFWAVLAVVICSGIGVGFGLYPAWKASRLDPVEALRFE